MKSPENFKKSIPENLQNSTETQKEQNLQETKKEVFWKQQKISLIK